MKKFIVAFLLISCFVFAESQELVTDRPDQTESAVSVPKGSLQIESGAMIEIYNQSGVENRVVTAPTNLFRYGLLNNIEFRIGSALTQTKNLDTREKSLGISDIEVGFKCAFLSLDAANFQAAYLAHLSFPSGSSAESAGVYGLFNVFALSADVADNVSVGYNFGFDYADIESSDESVSFIYTAVVGVGVSEKSGLFAEIYGEHEDEDNSAFFFDAGFTYLLRENLQIDFSFGSGTLANEEKYNFLSTGLSWRLDRPEE